MRSTEQLDVPAWWFSAIRACAVGEPPPRMPEEEAAAILCFARTQRLEPLLALWGGGSASPAYWSALARGEFALQEGLRVWKALEEAGIPVLPMRGPFSALRWHGDAGARWFTDVDILVPVASRSEACSCLGPLGYHRREARLPDAYYHRVHLHYPLQCPERGVLLDLHWSVDHPFVTHRINYADLFDSSSVVAVGPHRWRVPSPVHELLLQVAHLRKECGQVRSAVQAWSRAIEVRQMPGLVDLVLMARQYAGVDWERMAGAWGLLEIAQPWMEAALQPPLKVECVGPESVHFSRWESLGAFRFARWADLRAYFAPPARASWPARWKHRISAACHVGTAGAVAAACLVAGRLRAEGRP